MSEHMFEGQPDARQSADPKMPTSRFRPRYRALTDAEKRTHDELKEAFAGIETMILERIPPGRYRSLAMTELELACMWAVKELTT